MSTSFSTHAGGFLTQTPNDVPSAQELEVIRFIAEGHKDVAIARRLNISVVTVRRRAREFRLRVGAANRSEAIARAAAMGWLATAPGEGDEE